MNYEISGPFEIERNGRLVAQTVVAKREFWKSVNEAAPGLSEAVGCYIFCVGSRPWYVGLAEKQSFRSECFTHHKINVFNTSLNKTKRGKPYLIFVSKLTNTNRYAMPGVNGHRATRFLEDLLIGMALAKNPFLENLRGTKLMRELIVPGVINTPKGRAAQKSAQILKGVLGT